MEKVGHINQATTRKSLMVRVRWALAHWKSGLTRGGDPLTGLAREREKSNITTLISKKVYFPSINGRASKGMQAEKVDKLEQQKTVLERSVRGPRGRWLVTSELEQ